MDLPFFILQLAGATMLLLYAVRMVRTGIERSSGTAMRRVLIGQGRSRAASAVVGALIAILLQSATAAALLTAGFAASGLVSFLHGLSIMLGADFGSALVVQILSFKLTWLIPVLLTAGGYLFLKTSSQTGKQAGRILMGIAFILIALGMISQASAPMRNSTVIPEFAGYLGEEPSTGFIVGALIAFIMHSSVAAILLFVTLAAHGILPVDAGIAVVLGANFGGATLAVWLSRDMEPVARRIPLGNLILRGVGAILIIFAMTILPGVTDNFDGAPGQTLVSAHLAFNAAVLIFGLPLVGVIGKLVVNLLPDRPETTDGAQLLRPKSALDPDALETPNLALACVTREVIRMGEEVQTMVSEIIDTIATNDKDRAQQIKTLEQSVNNSFDDIRRYVADMSRVGLGKPEARRARELTEFSINLEAAADIVVKSMMRVANEKRQKKLEFSKQGWRELVDMHEQLISNSRLALNMLLTEDIDAARTLVEEKTEMTQIARKSRKRHLKRLASGEEISFETSDMHLVILQSLKDINSMFASIAYPTLYRNNQILDSRLVEAIED